MKRSVIIIIVIILIGYLGYINSSAYKRKVLIDIFSITPQNISAFKNMTNGEIDLMYKVMKASKGGYEPKLTEYELDLLIGIQDRYKISV